MWHVLVMNRLLTPMDISRLKISGLNRAILFFAGLIFLGILISAVHRYYYPLPYPIVPVAERVSLILLSYLVATVFLRITIVRVLAVFNETIQVEQRILVTKLYTAIVYLAATVVVFWQLGVTGQSIMIFLGLATTGIAFALRDILLSFFAWYLLLSKRPFRIGDYISIDGVEGRVEHIGTFYVFVDETPETYEDVTRIPNRTFLDKPFRNYGRKNIPVSVRYKIGQVPRDLAARKERAAKRIGERAKNAQIYIDSSGEGVFAIVQFSCSFEERSALRDHVVSCLAREFPQKKS